jgi:hypothetical protein
MADVLISEFMDKDAAEALIADDDVLSGSLGYPVFP